MNILTINICLFVNIIYNTLCYFSTFDFNLSRKYFATSEVLKSPSILSQSCWCRINTGQICLETSLAHSRGQILISSAGRALWVGVGENKYFAGSGINNQNSCNEYRCILLFSMIKNFRQSWLEDFWNNGRHKKVSPSLRKRLLRKLDMLNAAKELIDLSSPPSNHLHSLSGDRESQWAISVSGSWRLCFNFQD